MNDTSGEERAVGDGATRRGPSAEERAATQRGLYLLERIAEDQRDLIRSVNAILVLMVVLPFASLVVGLVWWATTS